MATRTATEATPSARIDLRRETGGRVWLALTGRLDAQSTASVWRDVETRLQGEPVSELKIDASGLDYCDGSGMALLHHLSQGGMTPGAKADLQGLRTEFERIYQSFSVEDQKALQQEQPEKLPAAEEVGRNVMAVLRDLRDEVAFIGQVTLALVTTVFHRRAMRWPEVLRVIELAGANALPIVSLISLLVGLIIAFQAAQPLAQFGAQIFIANMIGLVMVRELGPIMTAIMLAGRSGSAFAAELGTMKVNEELNALETMGLDPVRFLVVQRIVAGVLLTPLLTIYSMFMGVLGGVVVMLVLGFPLVAIYNQLVSGVVVGDVLLGTAKGFVFGLIVAAVGCLRGLQTKKGPSAVGESTTRSVVAGILLIIIADAVIALLTFTLEI